MSEKEEIIIQPYDWAASDEGNKYMIRCYGHNQNSERVLVRIEDFEPYIRIELPDYKGKNVESFWTPYNLKLYANWLRQVLGDHAPTKIQFERKQKLYYYQDNRLYPFLVCKFRTYEAMRHCINLLAKKEYVIKDVGKIKARVWETAVTQIHKLLTEIKGGYGKWTKFQSVPAEPLDKISHCPLEYICSYTDITIIPDNESKDWKTYPKIGSFDFECYSSNPSTMPNKNYATDQIFQASYISQRLNDPASQKKYLICIGPCKPIPNAETINCNNEPELINHLCDIIAKEDPSIITGYNIYRFDVPYLSARLNLYGMSLKSFGILKNEVTTIKKDDWKSDAYGLVILNQFKCEGRLNADIYQMIKKDYKLDEYRLDYVSKRFLQEGKRDISPEEMFKWYKKSLEMQESIKACLHWWAPQFKEELNLDYAKVSPEFILAALNEPSDEQIAYLKKLEKEWEEIAEWLKTIGDYCVQDSILPIKLIEKINYWIIMVESSTIFQVPAGLVYTKGQQIRVFNLIYFSAFHEGFVIDEQEIAKTPFTGAFVFPPKSGKYRNVIPLDYASLYPSIIRAYNICYTTYVPHDRTDIPDEMCNIYQWEENGIKFKERFIKESIFRGILPRMCEKLVNDRTAVRKQISPLNDEVTNIVLEQRQLGIKASANSIYGFLSANMLKLMAGARFITAMGQYLNKKSAQLVKDRFNGDVVYGDTDSIHININEPNPIEAFKKGKIMEKAINENLPPPLNQQIEGLASSYFLIKKKRYAEIMAEMIYMKPGDIISPIPFDEGAELDGMTLWKVVQPRDIVKMVKGEKVNIHDEKPKWILLPTGVDPSGEPVIPGLPVKEGGWPDESRITKKGTSRREVPMWVREIHSKMLSNILFDQPIQKSIDLIDDGILSLLTMEGGGLKPKKLGISKEMGQKYKEGGSYWLATLKNELFEQGNPIEGGERFKAIVVNSADPNKNKLLGHKARILERYLAQSPREKIDKEYYIGKSLANLAQQALSLAYGDFLDKNEAACKPVRAKRGWFPTCLTSKYVKTWLKLYQRKTDFVNSLTQFIKPMPSFDEMVMSN